MTLQHKWFGKWSQLDNNLYCYRVSLLMDLSKSIQKDKQWVMVIQVHSNLEKHTVLKLMNLGSMNPVDKARMQ